MIIVLLSLSLVSCERDMIGAQRGVLYCCLELHCIAFELERKNIHHGIMVGVILTIH